MNNERTKGCAVYAARGSDLLVYLCLRRRMNPVTGEALAPVRKVAVQTGLSVVTVAECVRRLVDIGMVGVRRSGRASVYSFPSNVCCDDDSFIDSDMTPYEKGVEAARRLRGGGEDHYREDLDARVRELEAWCGRAMVAMEGMAAEIDALRRFKAAMMGIKYEPYELKFDGR